MLSNKLFNLDEKLKISGKRRMESCSRKEACRAGLLSIIDWMKRNTSFESNNSGIITVNEGHEISYNERMSGWSYK